MTEGLRLIMKTLDEVIKANECCDHGEPDSRCEDCPYNGIGACCLERENDALYYLKKYRDNFEARNNQVERYQKAAKDCEEILTDYVALKQYWAEQQVNNPLTMEYFSKQIDTEPIWCEKLGEWYLFLAYDDGENEIQLMSDKGDIETFNEEDLEKYPLYRRK